MRLTYCPLSIGVSALILIFPATVPAQQPENGAVRKQAVAARVADGAIRLDGRLDEAAWVGAAPLTGFIQKEPVEGAAPTEQMDVRIVYDSGGIYVGARMYNRARVPIQAPMGRRDDVEDQAEHILVSFDTFHDRRTAYAFGVSSNGVRIDRFYPSDDEETFDEGFDPVWQARTSIEAESWTAELWIPLSQLRFAASEEQVWGLNVQRFTPTLNELDYWIAVPRTQRGWASYFGELRGIEGIRPTRRIELLPYVAGASTVDGTRDPGNPFDDGLARRVGADLKMGLGPNLTLEATVNPDFGQVEADPAEVNLSAFETFFAEKRPFFTEGAGLFALKGANNFFYSRRIGAPPTAPVAGDYVDYPQTSTIATAAKLTGRLASGTSVGLIGAVTTEESARRSNLGSATIDEFRVAPWTTYGLARVQQEFGPSGSTAGVLATFVHRDFVSDDPLERLLSRRAFTVAGDSILRFKGGEYELSSYGGFTYVEGSAEAIGRIQRASSHFLQRPDRTGFRYDPTRTSMAGYKAGGMFERRGGRHWLWSALTDFEAPGFETNDMGRLNFADGIRFDTALRYRETIPGKVFRSYVIGASQRNEWSFDGQRQGGNVRADATLTFLNFWAATLATGPNFRILDQRLTRGGPLMSAPRGWTTTATLKNRLAAQTAWNTSLTRTVDELDGDLWNLSGGVSFRPAPQWQLSVTPTYIREIEPQQYVTALGAGSPETYGTRYIFSRIDRTTVSTQMRMGYTFRPDLNLDLYAEPFAASGRFYDWGELPASRALHLRTYGTSGTTITRQSDGSQTVTDGSATFTLRNNDFNVRSFRSNLVLRWEWRPGSTLYVVWQQDRRVEERIGERIFADDLFRSFTAPGRNFFVVKTSFWLPL